MKRFIILMASAVILMVSCNNKVDTDYYIVSDRAMGTIENAVFTSDRAIKMNVKSAPDGCDINTKRRVMIYFVLKTDGQLTSYDINITKLFETVTVEPSVSEKAEDSPEGDPMNLVESWFGGGYLNMYAFYYTDPNNNTEQVFTSSYTCKESLSSIAVRRDGKGEGYFSVEDAAESYSYICIPMKKIWDDFINGKGGDTEPIDDPQEGRSMPVNLNWIWHAVSDNVLLPDTVAKNAQGIYYADQD